MSDLAAGGARVTEITIKFPGIIYLVSDSCQMERFRLRFQFVLGGGGEIFHWWGGSEANRKT